MDKVGGVPCCRTLQKKREGRTTLFLLLGSSLLFVASGILLCGLLDEHLVDVGDHTTTGNGGVDKGVELLVSADSELEMARGDTLDLEILGGVTSKLEDLGGEVLKDGSAVDGSGSSNTTVGLDALLQESVDTTDRELKSSPGRSGDALLSLGTSHCCLLLVWIRGCWWFVVGV